MLQVCKKQIRKYLLELKLVKIGKAIVNTLISEENMDSAFVGADLETKLMEKAPTHCLFCFGCLAVKFDLPAFETIHTVEEDQGNIYFFGGLCQTWEVSDDWKMENVMPCSGRAKGRFWGHLAHQSTLSPGEVPEHILMDVISPLTKIRTQLRRASMDLLTLNHAWPTLIALYNVKTAPVDRGKTMMFYLTAVSLKMVSYGLNRMIIRWVVTWLNCTKSKLLLSARGSLQDSRASNDCNVSCVAGL